jgi:hypothetical protein
MRSREPIFLTAAVLSLALFATPESLLATTLEISNGANIKTELFRGAGDNGSITPSFSFTLPDTAASDGLFEMFAGGDLNNLTDKVSVSAGGQPLGALNFPIDPNDPLKCEGTHGTPAPAGCPVPDNVPGGAFNKGTRGNVSNIEGRRDVAAGNFGSAGLIVPKSLLVGGTTLTFDLQTTPGGNGVYDLYIDKISLVYTAVPEPAPFALLALGLLALFVLRTRKP